VKSAPSVLTIASAFRCSTLEYVTTVFLRRQEWERAIFADEEISSLHLEVGVQLNGTGRRFLPESGRCP
jgi:hypothetical protein